MQGDPDDDYYRPQKKGSRGWLGWVLLLLVLGLAGAFVYYLYLPLRKARAGLEADLSQAKDRERRTVERLKQSEARFAALEQDLGKVSGELRQTVAEKEKIEGELKGIQTELSKKLEPEIQEGNVRIRRRGQDLVLDMADQILFDLGQAEVNDSGKKVLAQVAQSVSELRTYSLEVAGHTDSTRDREPRDARAFSDELGALFGARHECRPVSPGARENPGTTPGRYGFCRVPPHGQQRNGNRAKEESPHRDPAPPTKGRLTAPIGRCAGARRWIASNVHGIRRGPWPKS